MVFCVLRYLCWGFGTVRQYVRQNIIRTNFSLRKECPRHDVLRSAVFVFGLWIVRHTVRQKLCLPNMFSSHSTVQEFRYGLSTPIDTKEMNR
jgi:hypothetical protein